jgi:hypothetical protein
LCPNAFSITCGLQVQDTTHNSGSWEMYWKQPGHVIFFVVHVDVSIDGDSYYVGNQFTEIFVAVGTLK